MSRSRLAPAPVPAAAAYWRRLSRDPIICREPQTKVGWWNVDHMNCCSVGSWNMYRTNCCSAGWWCIDRMNCCSVRWWNVDWMNCCSAVDDAQLHPMWIRHRPLPVRRGWKTNAADSGKLLLVWSISTGCGNLTNTDNGSHSFLLPG